MRALRQGIKISILGKVTGRVKQGLFAARSSYIVSRTISVVNVTGYFCDKDSDVVGVLFVVFECVV